MTNHALQILFAPREHRDANTYSEMLGTYTAKGTSTGRSVNLGPGAGGSNSETGSDQRRPLLLPQELKALSPGTWLPWRSGAENRSPSMSR